MTKKKKNSNPPQNNQKNKNNSEWAHIAVRPESKKRFEFLMSFLVTRKKPKVTQDELLIDMMDMYEKKKTPALIANANKK